MRLGDFAFVLFLASEGVSAAPRPRGKALAITVIPREFKHPAKRSRPSVEQTAANGRACGNTARQGVCDNGRCGNFVAPTGFDVIPGAESQCGGSNSP
ncbi:hypothetical protein ColKHC_03571 [Colletotrichum higginsianum]|uniref:Secreted protein n=1 Tax=Colletotrichum destructivum TaxID=34406 RepID=A0AAX4I0L9_9PEZI|nr:hypothetical protein CDEST_01647 [Colletotrichum destructivum]GJC94745.1 hypothetical protein ColKHC_03571 [Colletotrichum higginsianum]